MAYIWTHNGLRIRDSDVRNSNYRLVTNVSDDFNEIIALIFQNIDGGLLVIYNTTFSDGGEYECIIKSAVGEIASKSYVVIEGPPRAPGNIFSIHYCLNYSIPLYLGGLQVTNILKTSVTLQWIDGAANGRRITSYTLSGRTNWNDTWVNIAQGLYPKEIDRYIGRKQATVENVLTPWATYEFRVAAWNELGMGPPSAPSPRHSTTSDKPYNAPRNVGGGGGKIGDLTITWTPLRSEEQNGPGIHYKIFWKRKNHDTDFSTLILKEYGNTGNAVVHIEKEYFYTQYIVKVQVIFMQILYWQ